MAAENSVYRARSERVEDFLDGILSLQFTRRVSRDSEDLESFGLGEARTVDLLNEDGRLIERLYFGDTSELPGEQYFRMEDVSGIYAIDTSLQFYLDQSSLYWTELRLWDDPSDEPVTFYRSYADGRQEDWRKDEEDNWLSATGEEAPSQVATAARGLLRLEGEDIVGSLADDAQYLLSAGIETDKNRMLEVMIYSHLAEGEDSSTLYYVSQSEETAQYSPEGKAQIYILPEWRYTELTDF